MYDTRRQAGEAMLELVLCPLVVLHELSHLLVARALGITSSLQLNCFNLGPVRSHVRHLDDLEPHQYLLIILAPYSLLPIALGITVLGDALLSRNLLPTGLAVVLSVYGLAAILLGRTNSQELTSLFGMAEILRPRLLHIVVNVSVGIQIFLILIWANHTTSTWYSTALTPPGFLVALGILYVPIVEVISRITGKYDRLAMGLYLKHLENLYDAGSPEQEIQDVEVKVAKIARGGWSVMDSSQDEIRAHVTMAGLALKYGNLESAREHTEWTLEIDPESADAVIAQAAVLCEQGAYDEAESYGEQALERAPDNPIAHSNYGEILTRQGRLDEARPHIERAIDANLDMPEIHETAASFYEEFGDDDAAMEHYRTALDIAPDDERIRESYREFLSDLGRTDLPIENRVDE